MNMFDVVCLCCKRGHSFDCQVHVVNYNLIILGISTIIKVVTGLRLQHTPPPQSWCASSWEVVYYSFSKSPTVGRRVVLIECFNTHDYETTCCGKWKRFSEEVNAFVGRWDVNHVDYKLGGHAYREKVF
jgi:hypothetical protein